MDVSKCILMVKHLCCFQLKVTALLLQTMNVPDSHFSYVQVYLEARCPEMQLTQKVHESVILTEIGKRHWAEDGSICTPTSNLCTSVFSHSHE